MLLAPVLPMSLSSAAPRARARRQRLSVRPADPVQLASQRRWVLGFWLILGTLAVICIAPMRGTVDTGWTLPFWLMAAPAINLVAMEWAQRRERRHRR
ncbi:MAG: hypothetical protein ABIP56_04175 [Dokdonella sp.]